MNTTKLLRAGLGSMLLALLLSCGGGGDYSGTASGSSASGGGSVVVDGGGAPGSGSGVDGGGSSGGGSSPGDGTTAGNGTGDGSGVGSGGTGVSTADAATSVGGVDGIGSIIVGGLRYDIDKATIGLQDASNLQIGMTVVVTGPVDATFTTGVATKVVSIPQLRGPVTTVDVDVEGTGSFVVQGITVSVDEGTVWGDLPGLASLPVNSTVQVWGLPSGAGKLRATRIETRSAGSTPLVSEWYEIPAQAGVQVQLEGLITDYASQGAFKLLGQSVDASAAQVTGGLAAKLADGVKVVASGTLDASGVLVASKLKIRHIPGEGALPSHILIGVVSDYVSPSDFLVKGQRVDASAAAITGTGTLANGVKVEVQGAQVVNNVLLATQLTFQ